MKKLVYFITGALFSLSATAFAATAIFTDQDVISHESAE